jgi:transcriptional regulator with XRE-family HTH domain
MPGRPTLRCMRGAGDHFTVGERIAFYRRRRGLTQGVLAQLVGRSEDWLSKIERNERDLRRLDMLTEVARALRVSVGDLLGTPVLVEDGRPTDDNIPAVRDALMNHRRLSRTLFGGTVDAPDLTSAEVFTRAGWDDYQAGRIGRVIAALPGLLMTAQQLDDHADQRAELIAARTYHLTASTLSKVGESDLAWLAAERAMAAAEKSGSPLALASAARAGTHALLSNGRFEDAMHLGRTAVEWLKDNLRDDDPAALSITGMLYLRTATAAARRQDRATSKELLDRAAEYASRLGRDENQWHTMFGPTNVALHRIAAALDLGDVEWVIQHAPGVDTSGVNTERRVAHKIDLARAYSWTARDDEALAALLAAEQSAPQIVRHSAVVRETVKTLHRRGHAHGTNKALLNLAERCRALQ